MKLNGAGGIRTPGTLRYNGFQDRRLQPLGHCSEFFVATTLPDFTRSENPKTELKIVFITQNKIRLPIEVECVEAVANQAYVIPYRFLSQV